MLIWINVDARSWRSFTHRATCNIAAASAELRPGRIGLIAQDRSTKRALCKQAPPISINTGEKMDREVKIWDPVVRIGHWMVVVAFAVAYLVEDELLTVHVWAGYIAGAAVALRILWGFVGPERARFSNFVYGPRTIVTYLSDLARFRARRYLGHSPAGGAMAVALLAMLAGTVITGLMAYGADKKAGPLAPLYAAGAGAIRPRRKHKARRRGKHDR